MPEFLTVGALRKGYAIDQVDLFVREIEQRLTSGAPVQASEIRRAGFDLVHGGYLVGAVDTHLDSLEVRAVTASSNGQRRAPAVHRDSDQEAAGLAAALRQDRGQRFPRAGSLRRGYDPKVVDDFTDGLAGLLNGRSTNGKGSADRAAAVRSVVFRPRLGGYDEDAVDDYLDRVVDLLLRRAL